MQAGLFTLFIYLFIYCVAWRGVAFRVAFMGHWGGTLVAFTAFAAFIRLLGWSFYAHFEWLQQLGGLGRVPCGVYSVSSFFLGNGVGQLWSFSAFVVYMRDAG